MQSHTRCEVCLALAAESHKHYILVERSHRNRPAAVLEHRHASSGDALLQTLCRLAVQHRGYALRVHRLVLMSPTQIFVNKHLTALLLYVVHRQHTVSHCFFHARYRRSGGVALAGVQYHVVASHESLNAVVLALSHSAHLHGIGHYQTIISHLAAQKVRDDGLGERCRHTRLVEHRHRNMSHHHAVQQMLVHQSPVRQQVNGIERGSVMRHQGEFLVRVLLRVAMARKVLAHARYAVLVHAPDED